MDRARLGRRWAGRRSAPLAAHKATALRGQPARHRGSQEGVSRGDDARRGDEALDLGLTLAEAAPAGAA